MAMAAGKSAGKALRMADKAFKPPSEAAMAMTGNELSASDAMRGWRMAGAVFFWRCFDVDFGFMVTRLP